MKRLLSAKARVSSKGWIVIPKDIRDLLDISPGDEVRLTLWPSDERDAEAAGSLRLRKVPQDPVAATAGMLKRQPGEPLWTQDMVAEHRQELEQEERELRERSRKRRTSA